MHGISNYYARAGRTALVLALAGGLGLALSGCSGMAGKGGADRNNDGKISLQEFGSELKEMKHPKPGKWKIAAEGTAGDDASFIRFTGEIPVCSDSFWGDFDKGLAEMGKAENSAELDKALQKFAKENNGKFDLERFDIDGDSVDLKVSGSGKGSQNGQSIDGGAGVAIKGKISETLVDIEGKFDYNFTMNGEIEGNKMTLEAKMASITKLKAERVGECPPAPPRPEPQDFDFEGEPPVMMPAPVAPPKM